MYNTFYYCQIKFDKFLIILKLYTFPNSLGAIIAYNSQ